MIEQSANTASRRRKLLQIRRDHQRTRVLCSPRFRESLNRLLEQWLRFGHPPHIQKVARDLAKIAQGAN